MLQASQIGISVSDLTLIKEAPQSGTMKFGKNITDSHEFKLINQSVTGLYENSIDLLAI
jgi:CRISPR-associated endonuclease Csn1